ncbi:MAG: PocR ligand-binding domain-containing protein, partial [Pyrinomonadaceae bacterium]
MSERDENSNKNTFEMLSAESGLAIAVVDNEPREVYVANNNSICQTLNPDGEFSQACAEYCGKALDMTAQSGGIVAFECHAGLECRAVPVKNPNTPLVAIVGRTFVKSDNYRRATSRSMNGDWSKHSPLDLFENVLRSTSSTTLDHTARQVEELIAHARSQKKVVGQPRKPIAKTPEDISNLVEKFNREIRRDSSPVVAKAEPIRVERVTEESPAPPPPPIPVAAKAERRSPQTRAWRSFFGSLLKSDYPTACETILDFVAARFGLRSLVWLDRHENRLENTVAIGDMKDRKVRLGIAADDRRLIEAAESEMPLSLGER